MAVIGFGRSFFMVKTNPFVSSQARKVRKAYFNATKDEKHVALSAHLSKELQETHKIKRLPVRRDDEVRIVSGGRTKLEGKVTDVKLSEMRIYVDSFTKDKVNGQQVKVPIHPSNCVIIKLKMDKHRLELIKKKAENRAKALEKLGH